MKLLDYLKAQNLAVSEFAAQLGEAENTIRKIVYGQRQPSLPLAVKISNATGGATTPSELIVGNGIAETDNPPTGLDLSTGQGDKLSGSQAGAA